MKALYYQPSCGIAGDMHLAALVNLGVPRDYLVDMLRRLPIQDAFELTFEPASKMGISGLCVNIKIADQQGHRHHSSIVRIITEAGLPDAVTTRALAIFGLIANAEGKIHNIPPERVHFHEVGAMDSIIDIVGAAAAIEYLQPDIIICDSVEIGGGFVNCAHGRLPVPAPATQELLMGVPCQYGTVDGEATTPTGAAIIANAVSEFGPKGTFTPQAIGYGVGRKDFVIPNVLRVALGDYQTTSTAQHGDLNQRFSDVESGHYQVEANIDDMSAEAFGPLMDALFKAGAVEAFTQPVMMKKQRPAQCVTALCRDDCLSAVTDTLLNTSTSIGLRIMPFTKRVLPRGQKTLSTQLGSVSVKITTQPNGRERFKVEHDDILRLAAEHQLDYLSVQQTVNNEIARTLGHGT